MDNYKKILVALDYSGHADTVMARAIGLAADHGAALHLVHVVEYLPPMVMGDEPFPSSVWMIDEKQILNNARDRMKATAAQAGTLSVTEHVVMGAPRRELCAIAEQEQVDLMIAGSHGRHGVARLLGSTASGLVHHAPCDLLLVRIGE